MKEKAMRPVDQFVAGIMVFPDVQETEGDMFGERSFRVEGREFLHLHGSAVHMLLPREVKAKAIAEGRATDHPYARGAGRVALYLQSGGHVADALTLAKVSYDYVAGLGSASRSPRAPNRRMAEAHTSTP